MCQCSLEGPRTQLKGQQEGKQWTSCSEEASCMRWEMVTVIRWSERRVWNNVL